MNFHYYGTLELKESLAVSGDYELLLCVEVKMIIINKFFTGGN